MVLAREGKDLVRWDLEGKLSSPGVGSDGWCKSFDGGAFSGWVEIEVESDSPEQAKRDAIVFLKSLVKDLKARLSKYEQV